jgi:hypothetical protein
MKTRGGGWGSAKVYMESGYNFNSRVYISNEAWKRLKPLNF